jgi:pimeloyl-ACP methyl ester carboxylesterase
MWDAPLREQNTSFTAGTEIGGTRKETLLIREGTCEIAGRDYLADFYTLAVPENRTRPNARVVSLPVVRIRRLADAPAEPVFILRGGPGNSNIEISWFEHAWLLEHHDVVKVGYRGIDGSVRLESQELKEAATGLERPLSHENLRKLGKAQSIAIRRLMDDGVDINGYNAIEVVDDLEEARKALGYGRINLFSHSWGTRLAYLFGLRYPATVHRSLMNGVLPPGLFVWEPDLLDAQLGYYNKLWRQNTDCVSRTPDLIQMMRTVLATLPASLRGVRIDADRVKVMSFFYLESSVQASAKVFDAYLAAQAGDYRGLAYLSWDYDRKIPSAECEGTAKLLGLDYNPDRDYETELDPPGSVIGSPWAKLQWAPTQYWDLLLFSGKHPIHPVAERYRTFQYTDVDTLMVSGSVDLATPVEKARWLLPYLRNGQHVTLAERGHMDLVTDHSDAYRHMTETFFLHGIADASRFECEPVDFKVEQTFQEMAKEIPGYAAA